MVRVVLLHVRVAVGTISLRMLVIAVTVAIASLGFAILPRLLAFAVPDIVDPALPVEAGLDPEVGAYHAAYHGEGR